MTDALMGTFLSPFTYLRGRGKKVTRGRGKKVTRGRGKKVTRGRGKKVTRGRGSILRTPDLPWN